jgi:hypothetical protein
MGDNAVSQWIWFNMIDEVLSGTSKADGVPGSIDNGRNVRVDDQPLSQPEEESQQVPKEEQESLRTRASILRGIREQPVKRRKAASDMMTYLDRFCESTRRLEELKLKATIKLHKVERKLEIEMFKLTHALHERMTSFFANVLQGLKKQL